jgi:hypothetical protein
MILIFPWNLSQMQQKKFVIQNSHASATYYARHNSSCISLRISGKNVIRPVDEVFEPVT